MIKTSLVCLSLSICLVGIVVSSHAPAHARSSKPTGVSRLLEQSIARMKTLRSLHGEGYLQGGSTVLRISADCVGQVPLLQGKKRPRYSFRSSSWARGELSLSGKRPQRIDDYLIEIISGTTPALWERSPATHGAWRPLNLRKGKPPINTIYISELCRPLFANSFHFPVNSGWKDIGTTAFHGRRVRHVQMQADAGGGTRQTFTIYIDPRTLYFVHFQLAQIHPRSLESFDFSRFDAPVTITPPARIGNFGS
jgi:hypothetical protein